jgi:hypothetical protein
VNTPVSSQPSLPSLFISSSLGLLVLRDCGSAACTPIPSYLSRTPSVSQVPGRSEVGNSIGGSCVPPSWPAYLCERRGREEILSVKHFIPGYRSCVTFRPKMLPRRMRVDSYLRDINFSSTRRRPPCRATNPRLSVFESVPKDPPVPPAGPRSPHRPLAEALRLLRDSRRPEPSLFAE